MRLDVSPSALCERAAHCSLSLVILFVVLVVFSLCVHVSSQIGTILAIAHYLTIHVRCSSWCYSL